MYHPNLIDSNPKPKIMNHLVLNLYLGLLPTSHVCYGWNPIYKFYLRNYFKSDSWSSVIKSREMNKWSITICFETSNDLMEYFIIFLFEFQPFSRKIRSLKLKAGCVGGG